jgi:hypothetical protein
VHLFEDSVGTGWISWGSHSNRYTTGNRTIDEICWEKRVYLASAMATKMSQPAARATTTLESAGVERRAVTDMAG